MTAVRALARLERLQAEFGGDAAPRKLALLDQLGTARLATAAQVKRLHESLCFLHAFPDTDEIFAAVDRLLGEFSGRPDLRRHRHALVDSGIAGTDTYYQFYASTAVWLADRWPDRLFVDWDRVGLIEELDRWLHLLVPYAESPGFDEPPLPMRAWIERLRGHETDATLLIRRFAALPVPRVVARRVYDAIDMMVRLEPGPGTPSRTGVRFAKSILACQRRPLRHERPVLGTDIVRPPRRVRAVARGDAERLIDLAREAMVTRSRDLYTFQSADAKDVRLIDCGDGLELACIGVVPEQRLLLEGVYGWLILRNGVPIGYVLTSALFNSSEIAFNVFETFRGAEAAWVYGRVLAATRLLFGSDTFTIYPYQLGYGNDEGLQSGAWWFYYKLGFQPRDPVVRRMAEREVRRMERRPSYRSSLETLKTLASRNLFFEIGERRQDVIGVWPANGVGLAVTEGLVSRFGSDRERAVQACADEAADVAWAGNWRRFPDAERQAWERWSALIVLLPGVRHWTPDERRALVEIVRAKGGRRESDFVVRFDQHRRLRTALRSLGRAHASREGGR